MKNLQNCKATSASKLLDVIHDHELLNLEGKQAAHVIHQLVHLLIEDAYWTEKYITQKDALQLINAFENFAHTGKRNPTYLSNLTSSK